LEPAKPGRFQTSPTVVRHGPQVGFRRRPRLVRSTVPPANILLVTVDFTEPVSWVISSSPTTSAGAEGAEHPGRHKLATTAIAIPIEGVPSKLCQVSSLLAAAAPGSVAPARTLPRQRPTLPGPAALWGVLFPAPPWGKLRDQKLDKPSRIWTALSNIWMDCPNRGRRGPAGPEGGVARRCRACSAEVAGGQEVSISPSSSGVGQGLLPRLVARKDNAKQDWVFSQYYPVLRAAAPPK
jgi:hypothetical protein